MADNTPDNNQVTPDNSVIDVECIAENKECMADSGQDNNECMADSGQDNNECMADSGQDNNECMADNCVDNETTDSETEKNLKKYYIEKLEEKYKIGHDTVYKRMKYLNITPYKDGRKSYLTVEQMIHMNGLHEHLQNHRSMKGYPKPEPSGPSEQKEVKPEDIAFEDEEDITDLEEETAITVMSSQITVEPNHSISRKRKSNIDAQAIATIVNNAQKKASQTLIAENLLARDFIENPELLPEDLRAQIEESAQIPEIDPLEYGGELLRLVRQKAGVAG